MILAGLACTGLLAACGSSQPEVFKIVSGSENKVLEPIVTEFCNSQGVQCTVSYEGSLDIGLALKSDRIDFDAVWPASSVWIDLYDTGRKVKHLQSVAQMPVILGVRLGKARELGWVGKPVAMSDILAAVVAGRLRFIMSSATQSNSGASAYLAMLATALGDPQVIEGKDLEDAGLRQKVQALLRGVERTAGSSGWLAELYVERAQSGTPFDAMWNYEAVLKDTNDQLAAAGREKLYAIYPADGVSVADSPLGFVARPGDSAKAETFFLALQAYLGTEAIQQRIAATGRRVPNSGAAAKAEPDWNFDPARKVGAIRPPDRSVIERALVVYQEALRRPSLTALCLDFSGSMQSVGEDQLKKAVTFLLTPAATAGALVQWTPADRILIIPFNDRPIDMLEGSGTPADQGRLLAAVQRLRADGGTDMYACGRAALQRLSTMPAGDYLPAIVMMTDGKTEGSAQDFLDDWKQGGTRVPVFGITFGDADKSQLDALAKATEGRVFDGSKDLSSAFRATRGYN